MAAYDDVDPARRAALIHALAAGLYSVATPALAAVLGNLPAPLAAGKSIHALNGRVLVNGQLATAATVIRSHDTVETGADGRAIFVVGRDAFVLRASSKLKLEPDPEPATDTGAGEFTIGVLRLVTGKILSVFGKSRHTVVTATATIGIRGTGLYVEADDDESYVCTCYGTVDIRATDDATQAETITSKHHDAPRYILAATAAGPRIRPAPAMKNHTDEELALIEALAGRSPPFVLPGDAYSSPRHTEY